MKLLLDKVYYNAYKWKICSDLKVVNILMGLKSGYTSNQCFHCLFRGRDEQNTYAKKVWEKRGANVLGKDSVIKDALVDKNDIIFPPLHIKLGLVYSFIYRMAKTDSEAFKKLSKLFPDKTKSKINAGKFKNFDYIFLHD